MKTCSATALGNTANIPPNKILAVGLTGGMGSGKSTVAQMFAEYGVTIIDSDLIARELTQAGGTAIAAIRAVFGDEYLDASGALNRAKMRERIFTNHAAKLQLEAILHPLIRTQMQEQMRTKINSTDAAPYIILVVPLLFETAGFRELAQSTLLVDCDEKVRIERVKNRDGLDEPSIRRIMATQMPRADQLQIADHVIQNNGGLEALKVQVAQQHRHYLTLCARAIPRND